MFLKDNSTKQVLKFGTQDNELILFVDQQILKRTKSYSWAVSYNKFENSDKLKFKNFIISSSDDAKTYAEHIKLLTIELKKVGFTQAYIKKRIQEHYNFYY